jgi:hypothetical protein
VAEEHPPPSSSASAALSPLTMILISMVGLAIAAFFARQRSQGTKAEDQNTETASSAAEYAVEAAIESFDIASLKELLSSAEGRSIVAAGSPLPKSGLNAACTVLLGFRKWQRALTCALLNAPHGVLDRLVDESAAHKGVRFELYENLSVAADILSRGEPGLPCLVRYWALCGSPSDGFRTTEDGSFDTSTVWVGGMIDVVGSWTALMLNILFMQGEANLNSAGTRCGGKRGEGGWTVLHYACSSAHGCRGLAKWLTGLKHKQGGWAIEDVQVGTESFQMTPLHLAAIEGGMDSDAARTLLGRGAKMREAVDIFGRNPEQLAAEASRAAAVGVTVATKSSHFGMGSDGSWDEALMPSLESTVEKAECPGVIEVFLPDHADWMSGLLSSVTLVRDVLLLERPAILRGVNLGNARHRWSKDALLNSHGHMKLPVSGVPFSERYGGEAPTTVDLGLFCQEWPQDEDGNPLYLFSRELPVDVPELLEDLDLPECMSSLVDLDVSLGHTFYVGPRGSGAPFHDHTAAWNASVYGYKQWYFLPPSKSITSRKHIARWSKEDLEHTGCIKCIQGPGDVVLVPSHWTHAVLNLTETVSGITLASNASCEYALSLLVSQVGMAGEVRADASPSPISPILLQQLGLSKTLL